MSSSTQGGQNGMEETTPGGSNSSRSRSNCCGRLGSWLCSTNALLYISHTLSAWGDRMWQFATGMFLIALNPGSLRLTAIYTFTSGGTILLLGAIVGSWVDKYPRLRVVRTAIVVQNLGVACSAITVCLTVLYEDEVRTTWGGWLMTVCQVIIILFAVIGDVASVGRTIAVERDWIVVICGDQDALTSMSALLRRIDLTTKLIAPVMTGQIITYGSMFIGAVFIACWNVMSMVAEYCLLYKVYCSVPELEIKHSKPHPEENQRLLSGSTSAKYDQISRSLDLSMTRPRAPHSGATTPVPRNKAPSNITEEPGCCELFLEHFLVLGRGWKTYMQQSIVLAGFSLSTLYMTVLGFDNITMGFAKEEGLTESVIGILQSAGAICGIIGTICMPVFRKRLGIEKTGMLSFLLELVCLVPCVLSVFAPGSPFEPNYLLRGQGQLNQTCVKSGYAGQDDLSLYSFELESQLLSDTISDNILDNNTIPLTTVITCPDVPSSYWSIGLLMGGIVAARFGLWMSDLTVTQLLLEKPDDNVRGVVNGVQNSLNQSMDLLKSLLVILLPDPEIFGYLVIASVGFVCLGFLLFSCYAIRSLMAGKRDFDIDVTAL